MNNIFGGLTILDNINYEEVYSQNHELRFHNIPESSGEHFRQKIQVILAQQLSLGLQIAIAPRVGSSIARAIQSSSLDKIN